MEIRHLTPNLTRKKKKNKSKKKGKNSNKKNNNKIHHMRPQLGHATVTNLFKKKP